MDSFHTRKNSGYAPEERLGSNVSENTKLDPLFLFFTCMHGRMAGTKDGHRPVDFERPMREATMFRTRKDCAGFALQGLVFVIRV